MLVLTPPDADAVQRFRRGDATPAEIRDQQVLRRWQRVARRGVLAEGPAFALASSSLAMRQARVDEVFRETCSELDVWTTQIANTGVVALVADAEGVIVRCQGGASLSRAAEVRLIESARWDEDARGTNAIGTALLEGCDIGVIGAAHYEERNHGLFCYASPVHDPYGNIIAVLDITGPVEANDVRYVQQVTAARAKLEQAIRARAYAAAAPATLALVDALLQRSSEPTLLLEASGHVATANAAARALISNVPLTCAGLFRVTFADLALRAHRVGDVICELPTGEFRVDLEPVQHNDGRVLAILATFKRSAARQMPAPAMAPAMMPARTATSNSPSPALAISAAAPSGASAFDIIVANDAQVNAAKQRAAQFAQTELPILLLAETGTGKELFARAIHRASSRAKGPFVALNCGALTPSLLESELFGHAPGAFTGATRSGSDGVVGAAHGGTLFLDEIAEMPEALQAVLLRVLDEGVYHRVGETRPRKSDFRLVSATCRALPNMVMEGKFRSDLFYRIQGVFITIPPVRERSDGVALVEHFMQPQAHTIAADAAAWIKRHTWPGNVRELKSAVAHACAMTTTGVLQRDHFPASLLDDIAPRVATAASVRAAPSLASATRTRTPLSDAEIDAAVTSAAGNVSVAARRLGVARSTVYRVRAKRKP